MQKHIKNYYKTFSLTCADEVFCTQCGALAVDIHHISFRSQGGSDEVENLIALCRKHHLEAHEHNTIEHRQLLTELQLKLLDEEL